MLVFTWGDNNGHSEIYTILADGTGERQLTNGGLLTPPIMSRSPAWSPDGTKIAFNAGRQLGGHIDGGIYVMNADGGHQVRVSGSRTYATDNPTWSPDGTMIAYAAFADTSFYTAPLTSIDMFVVNADGSGERRLASLPGYEFFPAWSPARARIAFASLRRDRSAYELYAIKADGTGLTRLDVDVWPERPPSWSPDGTRIAFVSYPDLTSDIYTVRSDGTGLTRLTNSAAADRAPLWRPAPGKD